MLKRNNLKNIEDRLPPWLAGIGGLWKFCPQRMANHTPLSHPCCIFRCHLLLFTPHFPFFIYFSLSHHSSFFLLINWTFYYNFHFLFSSLPLPHPLLTLHTLLFPFYSYYITTHISSPYFIQFFSNPWTFYHQCFAAFSSFSFYFALHGYDFCFCSNTKLGNLFLTNT